MRKTLLALALLAGMAGVLLAVGLRSHKRVVSPWDHVPTGPAHFDHADVIQGPMQTGPEVTAKCLVCHPAAAKEVMQTSHWTWAGQKVTLPGSGEVVHIGKRNVINNFCIHAGPNIKKCASCHAGYGWEDNNYDFAVEINVDCLVCHDTTNTYQKGLAGRPTESVDLVQVARSVGRPTRLNCGQCHFKGGGGDAVKHGDLDGSMYFPNDRIDVHMGSHDFLCVDCHRTEKHNIAGYSMAVCVDRSRRTSCSDCHGAAPHSDERLDSHTSSVACQACHIPKMAIDAPTKMYWDWSEAGQADRPEDPHVYLKGKGSFRFAQNIRPEYYWYNGRSTRYLTGDKVDPAGVTRINFPAGDASDPDAKIWPFKVHRGKQVFDTQHQHLLTPRTWGPGGYWTDFDWDQACRLGSEDTGLPYSGEYDFVETEMYWPLSHMVQSKEKALQCGDCHGPRGGMDFEQLGYDGDPAYRGNRRRMGLVRELGAGR